jgi:hypothetical protein
MTEIEITLPAQAKGAQVIRAVERVAAEQALTLTLKGTLLKYPGCVHWHFKKDKESGTLEITWWPAQRRLWLKVALNRQNAWINKVIPHLKQSLEANL